MAKIEKFSTSTVMEDNRLSPWLSVSGELAYTPENPPVRDYFFQYNWIFPEICINHDGRRSRFYFGHGVKAASDFLFDFWNQARKGKIRQEVLCYGYKDGIDFTAPIAIYRYKPQYNVNESYLFIQHGSYQLIPVKEQPLTANGYLNIYRGIGRSKKYNYPKIKLPLTDKKIAFLDNYFVVQEKAFSDSKLSFAIAHSQVKRCETDFLNLDYWIWDHVAESVGFEWENEQFAAQLRGSYRQSFTLDERIAAIKFGPNYIKCITPVSNVRLSTFFAGENEVMIIDPRKIEIKETMKDRRHSYKEAELIN